MSGPVPTLQRRDAVEALLSEDEAYDVLGLEAGADPERVDAVHRRLASRAHPDRWVGAPADEQEGVRQRYEEVNHAYRVLKAARKAGLRPAPATGPAGPRRRPSAEAPPTPAPAAVVPSSRTASTGGSTSVDAGVALDIDIEDDPVRSVPAGLAVAAVAVAAVVALLAVIGLSSPSPDGSRQRQVLGPLAHQLLEAERAGDHGTMWDLAEDAFKASVPRDGFVARLDACPRRRPSRQVVAMVATSGGVWEVQWADPAGQPGLAYFRQEEPYRFGAILDDANLLELLAAPVESAPGLGWCQRR